MQRARFAVDRRDRRRLNGRFAGFGVDDLFRDHFNGRSQTRLVVREGCGTEDVEGVRRVDRAEVAARLVAGNRNNDGRVFRTRLERVRLNRAVAAASLVRGNRRVAADRYVRAGDRADVLSRAILRDFSRACDQDRAGRADRAEATACDVLNDLRRAADRQAIRRNRADVSSRRILRDRRVTADYHAVSGADRADRIVRLVAGNLGVAGNRQALTGRNRANNESGGVVRDLSVAVDRRLAFHVQRAVVSARDVARDRRGDLVRRDLIPFFVVLRRNVAVHDEVAGRIERAAVDRRLIVRRR